MNPFLEAAKQYLAAGLHPFPVEPKGKRPLVNWRQYTDTAPTPQQLDAWWRENPTANIGLPMGNGIFALDIDGEEGRAALAEAGVLSIGGTTWPDGVPFADKPHVSTGKGWHFYFAGNVPDRIGVLPKVDVRSSGGYVVAPPSIHPSGRQYEWFGDGYKSAPRPPEALVNVLLARPTRPTPVASAETGWVSAALSGVGEGERDTTCTRLAGYFIGRGIPPEVVETLLVDFGERCNPPLDAGQVAKCVQSIAKRDAGEAPAAPPADIKIAVAEAMAEITTPPAQRKLQGTEFSKLDEYLSGGFEPGEFAVNGAPPGTGKTAFLLQIARRKAEDGVGVLFITREMRRAALVRRWLVQVSGIRMSDVKSGQLVDAQQGSLKFAAQHLSSLPIWISSAATVEDIRQAMAQFEPGQLGIVFVDYLQLLRGGPGKEKRVEVGQISQALKDLAIDYGVPVVANSSLRRLAKMRDGSREKPEMSDLRESGEIEFGADIVTIMQRPFDSDLCELVVAKNRDGRVGTIKLRFQGDLMRFTEVAA